MAEIIETTQNHNHYASNSKGNAALTTGIIGTALGAIGVLGMGKGLLGGLFGGGTSTQNVTMTNEEVYLERKQCQNYLDITKQYYEGKIEGNERLTNAFFDAYKRDIDNSFALYKNQRDQDDILAKRIDEVDKKVDIMAAIRPYQDALIDSKINNTALVAQYNLDKKTCKMITGQVVLPSTPVVSGYGSYYSCPCANNTVTTA